MSGSDTSEIAGKISWQIPEGFVSSGPHLDGRNTAYVFGSLCMPRIVSGLHSRPDSGAVAKELAEPDRDRRGHRFSFLQDIVEMLARNREQSGDLGFGPTGSRNNVVAKQRAGMGRAPVLVALCRIHHVISFNGIARNRRRGPRHLRTRR